ncbi:hypothetical protein ONZ45_g4313 [Pleurotus djamor]|nr:hypothetical protein ONZ45_g4313 [Pleurotus djamor]
MSMNPTDQSVLVDALISARRHRRSYREALDGLQNVNGHSIAEWQEFFLRNSREIEALIEDKAEKLLCFSAGVKAPGGAAEVNMGAKTVQVLVARETSGIARRSAKKPYFMATTYASEAPTEAGDDYSESGSEMRRSQTLMGSSEDDSTESDSSGSETTIPGTQRTPNITSSSTDATQQLHSQVTTPHTRTLPHTLSHVHTYTPHHRRQTSPPRSHNKNSKRKKRFSRPKTPYKERSEKFEYSAFTDRDLQRMVGYIAYKKGWGRLGKRARWEGLSAVARPYRSPSAWQSHYQKRRAVVDRRVKLLQFKEQKGKYDRASYRIIDQGESKANFMREGSAYETGSTSEESDGETSSTSSA